MGKEMRHWCGIGENILDGRKASPSCPKPGRLHRHMLQKQPLHAHQQDKFSWNEHDVMHRTIYCCAITRCWRVTAHGKQTLSASCTQPQRGGQASQYVHPHMQDLDMHYAKPDELLRASKENDTWTS